jgi:AcrR family transcriptional regulator
MNQEETKIRVLLAAGEVFAERGFPDSTIREICRRAGANVASVNYHFQDKERLYRAVILHAHQMAVEGAPLPDWSPETPPETRLRDFIRTMLTRMLDTQRLPWQAQLMLREMFQPTGACQELVEEYIRPHFRILLEILDDLLPPGTAKDRRYKLAFSIVGQCMFYKLHQNMIGMLIAREELDAEFTTPQLADHIADVTLAALGIRPLFAANHAPTATGAK